MRKLLAVDPGVRATAVAAFKNGKLYQARLYRGKEVYEFLPALCDWAQIEGFDEAAIEVPQVYRNSPNPKNLIDLAFVGGAIWGALACELCQYLPRQWKGNQPKEATRRRVSNVLAQAESDKIEWPIPSLRHNVYDAVGIGLHHLGRL